MPAGPGAQLVSTWSPGVSGEVMVAGKLGDFGIAAHPLIDGVEMDGDNLVARRALSLSSDPWITDHAIDGKPVLPGVIGLEMMAAVAMMADPGNAYSSAEDVQYKAPVKLHGDTTTDVIVGDAVDGGVRCADPSETRTGRIIETEHFSAPSVGGTEASPFPLWACRTIRSAKEIYRRFFHGPAFQVLESASAVTADALLCDGRQHLAIAGGLLTAPLVLEAAEAAGAADDVDGVMALPQAIDSVVVERQVGDDEPIHLTVRRDGDAFDVDVSTDKGRVMARAAQDGRGRTAAPVDALSRRGGFSQAVIARVKSSSTRTRPQGDAQRGGAR